MIGWLAKFQVSVPEGVSGKWSVEKFTVTPEDEKLERLRAMINRSARFVACGDYTRLMRGGDVIMSDTHDEVRDHLTAIRKAHDVCLINGLGLGVVLQGMARKPEVTKVIVIEKSKDVVALVAPHYREMFRDKIDIIEADALEYRPEKKLRFSVVWHDIWDAICADNLDAMKLLHRRYGRVTDWQGSWGRDLIRR